jgi:hypothetical protein
VVPVCDGWIAADGVDWWHGGVLLNGNSAAEADCSCGRDVMMSVGVASSDSPSVRRHPPMMRRASLVTVVVACAAALLLLFVAHTPQLVEAQSQSTHGAHARPGE